MDPFATLNAAIEALLAGDLDECSELLDNYFEWRKRGGFKPDLGSHDADEVARRASATLLTARKIETFKEFERSQIENAKMN